jgi:hypothetical protein
MVDPKGCLAVEIVVVRRACLLRVQYASKWMNMQLENGKISWGKNDPDGQWPVVSSQWSVVSRQ